MIEVQPTTALLLYLALFLILCFGAWMIHHWKGRKKETLPPLYQMTHCEYCAFNYLRVASQDITSCPQCQAYNKQKSEKQ